MEHQIPDMGVLPAQCCSHMHLRCWKPTASGLHNAMFCVLFEASNDHRLCCIVAHHCLCHLDQKCRSDWSLLVLSVCGCVEDEARLCGVSDAVQEVLKVDRALPENPDTLPEGAEGDSMFSVGQTRVTLTCLKIFISTLSLFAAGTTHHDHPAAVAGYLGRTTPVLQAVGE
jgi:hypothetical protein